MAGIYIHIPFCRKACHYCDFHFSTNLSSKEKMVKAILKEIETESAFLKEENIDTIYFGGGTPSVLNEEELESIISSIEKHYVKRRIEFSEITLEANPDDLDSEKLKSLKRVGINRLSIGIQTLDENILQTLNRSHNRKQALNSLDFAFENGFEHVNVDFIYGIPGRTKGQLTEELKILNDYSIDHVSLYSLTIEENTVFGNWKRKGKFTEMDEEMILKEYAALKDFMESAGFEQYEISNFAKNENYALHNTNYWLGKKYLGLGPSAHSFDSDSRRMNPNNNAIYMKGIEENNLKRLTELLSEKDKFNEAIMTGLRTKWGVSKYKIQNSKFFPQVESPIAEYIQLGIILESENSYTLSEKGKLLADKVSSDLFVV